MVIDCVQVYFEELKYVENIKRYYVYDENCFKTMSALQEFLE